jgi:hypothetical protein
MRWEFGRRSDNVEDRRGFPLGGGIVGGGIGTIVLALLVWFLGGDPGVVLGPGGPGGQDSPSRQERAATSPEEDRQAQFASVVLAETEDVWSAVFSGSGRQYPTPTLVLFTGATQSGCGFARSQVGPFYCPEDRKLYLDLGFFDELSRRLGAPGDFARAYVIAHEVGHHVQNLLGILPKIHSLQARTDQSRANRLSVLLELQADCLAGVWANRMERQGNVVESGDIEAAVNAAASIGDDRLQRMGQGYVAPDSFTHGSSAQRTRWFRTGLRFGDVQSCDTFRDAGLHLR